MMFARSWNVPEFVIQAYVPKGIDYNKGKVTDWTSMHGKDTE